MELKRINPEDRVPLDKYRNFFIRPRKDFDEHYSLYHKILPNFVRNEEEFIDWLNLTFLAKEKIWVKDLYYCDLNPIILNHVNKLSAHSLKFLAANARTLKLTEEAMFSLLKTSLEHPERPFYDYDHTSTSVAAHNFSQELRDSPEWSTLKLDYLETYQKYEYNANMGLFYVNYLKGGDYLDPRNENPTLIGEQDILPHHRTWLMNTLEWETLDSNKFVGLPHHRKNAGLFIKYDSSISEDVREQAKEALGKHWTSFKAGICEKGFTLAFMLNSGDDYDSFINEYPHHSDAKLAVNRRFQNGVELSSGLKRTYLKSPWGLEEARTFNPSFTRAANVWVALQGYGVKETDIGQSRKRKVMKRFMAETLSGELNLTVDPNYPYQHLKDIFETHLNANPFKNTPIVPEIGKQ